MKLKKVVGYSVVENKIEIKVPEIEEGNEFHQAIFLVDQDIIQE